MLLRMESQSTFDLGKHFTYIHQRFSTIFNSQFTGFYTTKPRSSNSEGSNITRKFPGLSQRHGNPELYEAFRLEVKARVMIAFSSTNKSTNYQFNLYCVTLLSEPHHLNFSPQLAGCYKCRYSLITAAEEITLLISYSTWSSRLLKSRSITSTDGDKRNHGYSRRNHGYSRYVQQPIIGHGLSVSGTSM